MPKLSKALAKATKEAESTGGSRDVVPEGIYLCNLKSVESKTGKESGKPYWLWTFVLDEEDERSEDYEGKHFFLNTSLSENALWKMQEVFNAFGETPDTDTDTLVGEKVRLVVTQRPIGAGARAGEMSNQVENVLPAEPGEDEAGEEDGDGDPPF